MRKLLCLILALALLAVPVYGTEYEAKSWILMDAATGTVLESGNEHEKLAPASVTKVMTLLLIMEAIDGGQIAWGDTVTASETAAAKGGSQVYLKVGETMTVEEMVKSIAVSSANDCACAMAEHLAGSEAAFVEKMNTRAVELGMNDTHFVNCTGLPAQGHVSSAYDIALMSRELILNHPSIENYTTIWMDSIRDGTFGLTNTNRLIRFYQGATGLKTGSTQGALYCMTATARRDGMELIAVVMKSPTSAQRFEDAKLLLDHGFANYTLTDVYPDAPLPPVRVVLGTVEQVQPQLSRPCRLLVEKGGGSDVRTTVILCEDVSAPVEQGQTLGRMEVRVNGELRDDVPIVSAQGADRLTIPGIFLKLLGRLTMTG